MRFTVLLVLLSCSIFSVGGVGFKFHSNKRNGEKRLWLHVPGSDPNVLTDFEEKPYTGPKNLVDINRPSEAQKSSPSKKKDVEEFIESNPRRGRGRGRQPPKFERFLAYPNPEEEGYRYNPPNIAFHLPGELPQVGTFYPRDEPDEENFGIGQNSEENKDILAGRPFTPDSDAAEVFRPRPKPSTPVSPVYCPTPAEIAYGKHRPANCIPRPEDSDAAEQFRPRPKTTTQSPPVYCPTQPAFGYAPRRPPGCIPRPTPKPDDGAAEVFKPRPKPSTPASPTLCPSEAEIAYGRPRPANCIPRTTTPIPVPKEPEDDAAEVFKPRPKPTTPSSPVYCPTEPAFGYAPRRPPGCIPRPTTTKPDDGAAEVFKPRPKPTTPPTPQSCPTPAEIAYGRPRPAHCIQIPNSQPRPTTTPSPDDGAAEVFKPRPKPTTPPTPQYCPTEFEISLGRPRPSNCIPRPTTRPTIPPLCPEEGMDGYYRPRPHNCRPRPTTPKPTTTATPDEDAAEVFKPRPKPTTPPTPEFCPTEAEIAYDRPRPAHCIPRPTPSPPPKTTTPDEDAAEVFKPRPKPTTPPTPEFCPTEAEIAYGRPRPAHCIPRPTPSPPPKTTTPDEDAAEVFKPRPKPTTPPAPVYCPLEPEIGYAPRRPVGCIPRPTTPKPRTTTPDSDAAEVFKPRPKPTTPASPQYCPTEFEISLGRPANCIPRPTTRPTIPPLCPEEGMDGYYRPRPHNCRPRPTTPKPTTTTTPDEDAAEVFKPRPKPTTPPTPEYCPTEAEIAYGRPRPANCIPRPTPPPPEYCPTEEEIAQGAKRPPNCIPLPFCPGKKGRSDQLEFPVSGKPANRCRPRPTTTTPPPKTTTPDEDAAEVFKPRPKPSTPPTPEFCPTEEEIANGAKRPPNCIPLPFCPGKKGRSDRLGLPLPGKPANRCRPRPTTTTPPPKTTTPDEDAAEVFKPRPKPSTPASPVYCPTEFEIANGRPRPPNCIPRPTRPTTPPPRVYCPDYEEFGRPPPPNCIPKPTQRPYLPPRPIPEYLPAPPPPCSGYGPCPGEGQGGYGSGPVVQTGYGWGWDSPSNSRNFGQGIQPKPSYFQHPGGNFPGQGQILGTSNCGPGTGISCGHRSPRTRPGPVRPRQGGHNNFRVFGGSQSQPNRFPNEQQIIFPRQQGHTHTIIPRQRPFGTIQGGGIQIQGGGRPQGRRGRNFQSITSVHKIQGGTLTFVQDESRNFPTDKSVALRTYGNYGVNDKTAAQCGRDRQDEYFNHRIGRCIDRRASRIRY